MNNLQFWVQSLITLFIGLTSAGAFTIWRDKRKAEAETTRTRAEAGGVDADTEKTRQEWMSEEIRRLTQARSEEAALSLLRKRAGGKLYRYVLSNQTWNKEVMAKLHEHGIELPPPPLVELTQEEMDGLEV